MTTRSQTPSFRRLLVTLLAATTIAALTVACGDDGGELEILRMSPQSGALQGNQGVKIQGRNFRNDIGYTVYFGSQPAKSVTLLDPSTLQVMTPSRETPGAVDVYIAADDGPAFRIADGFRYEDMSGNVVEQMGMEPERRQEGGDSNLAY